MINEFNAVYFVATIAFGVVALEIIRIIVNRYKGKK